MELSLTLLLTDCESPAQTYMQTPACRATDYYAGAAVGDGAKCGGETAASNQKYEKTGLNTSWISRTAQCRAM
jgi:hypothetical protein